MASLRMRSNVETTFSATKRKWGGSVRSKTFTAQKNEVLAKILCHNLAVLCHAMFELGIAGPVRPVGVGVKLPPPLTVEEQARVRAALWFLHAKIGRWERVEKLVRKKAETLQRLREGERVAGMRLLRRAWHRS
jgi:hypothetical protein